jgi:hypothetical protein
MIIAQVTAAYTARARTLVTKMMFWALAGVTFSAAKIVSCNKKLFFHGLPATLLLINATHAMHKTHADYKNTI